MFRRNLPLFILFSVFAAILLANLHLSKFLIGWDNLMPELNIMLNIKRSFFSVWQEYQGLGLLAGNGHAAELPRQIILLFSSFILPLNLIRQFYVFLMLGTGVLGSYFLIRYILPSKNNIVAFVGALFYLLNLVTVQTFFVPFEPMITHYGFLPWLIFSLIYFLQNNTKKALILFILVNILSIPQGQVPTVFLVYLITLFTVLTVFNIKEKSREILKKSLKALALTFAINAFWLMPFLYFLLTNSGVALSAKINQMATENVILQNIAFGNIKDVMLLKGFWFNNVDPDLNMKFAYMMAPWRDYFANPLIANIGYVFFGVILIGLFSLLKSKKPIFISLGVLFVFSFTMLCTNTPPFSWIDNILRIFPIFNEVFRFPFTKFANLALLSYSVFFAGGIFQIYSLAEKRIKIKNISAYSIAVISSFLLLIFVFPVFKGNLFYYKEELSVPKEYFQVFDYFKNQNPNTRIANLPQYTFWGWNFYNWGYGGSGFLWYGIKQPILDRAFDVWSKNTENYYWELSYALYSKNPNQLKNVLNKYQINFLLVDNNVVKNSEQKSLFLPEIKQLIHDIPEIKKDASFGNIDIYKVNLKDNPKNFIFSANTLPSTNKFQWGENDKAFNDLGNYISLDTNTNYYYPFRTLFSSKNQDNQEFSAKETGQNIEFTQNITKQDSNTKLYVPQINETEKVIYAQIVQNKTGNKTITISLLIKTPQIFLTYKDNLGQDKKIKLWGEEKLKPIFIIRQGNDYGYYVNVNGVKSFKVEPFVYEGILGSTFLSTTQDNVIVFSNKSLNVSQSYTLTKDDIKKLFSQEEVKIPNVGQNAVITADVPKIEDNYENFVFTPSDKILGSVKNCDNFNNGPIKANIVGENNKKYIELSSNNSTACLSAYSSTLSHDQGYIAFIESENIKGRPFHFWVLNEDEKFAPIDTYLNSGSKLTTSTFIFSPQEQFGNAYSFHFDNISIAKDETTNRLGQIRIFSLPYNFLTSLYIAKNTKTASSLSKTNLSVNHPNESLYRVSIDSGLDRPTTLILSQSFNNGWKAYKVNKANGFFGFIEETLPFIFGSEIKNHILINNWENGWTIDNSSFKKDKQDVIVSYMPQYLEYFGFSILFIASVCVLRKLFKRKPTTANPPSSF